VYQFATSGEVTSVFDKENLTIDWSSFSKVSTLISQKLWKLEEILDE